MKLQITITQAYDDQGTPTAPDFDPDLSDAIRAFFSGTASKAQIRAIQTFASTDPADTDVTPV